MIVTKVVQARNIEAVDGKRKTFRKQLMMVLSLFLLFGLTWSVAFFSYGPMLIPSYYIFSVLNSFQGEKQSHAQSIFGLAERFYFREFDYFWLQFS